MRDELSEPEFVVVDGVIWFTHVCQFDTLEYTLPGVIWQVRSAEGAPLTVWPSISCQICFLHGWIRDGKWENA